MNISSSLLGFRLCQAVPRRLYSSWVRQIFGSKARPVTKEEEKHEKDVVEETAPPLLPQDYLREFVQVNLPNQYTPTGWTATPLCNDAQLKAKVLLSCERQFHCNFGDRQLGSIKTIQDVLRLISRPRKPLPRTVFPRIEQVHALPDNLSVQAASVQASSKKRVRQPFQNFDSPEHSRFLNKQQKEARKRKRRHLTAITKRYN